MGKARPAGVARRKAGKTPAMSEGSAYVQPRRKPPDGGAQFPCPSLDMATMTPYRRELPFIHRAWKTAVDHFPYGMGIKLSSTNGDQPHRGVKRRRVDDDSPEATLHGALGHLVSEEVADFEKTLRIELLQIHRGETSAAGTAIFCNGNDSPAQNDYPITRVRCRLTMCTWRPKSSEARVLYCDSQICNLKVIRDDDDVCRRARIYLASPFLIPAEKLYVMQEDDDSFDLAERYLIVVDLESAGGPNWPPLDLLPREERVEAFSSRPQQWALVSQVDYSFERGRASNPVHLRRMPGDKKSTGLMMDMDLRWSTCHATGNIGRKGEVADPPVNRVPQVNGVSETLTNGHRKDNQLGAAEDDQEEDHEEAVTPSRSLRTRGKQNYNLKLLSDKARGRERKERKRRKAKMENEARQITWILPFTGEVILYNYQCIRCFAVHSSMDQLSKHVEAHKEYKFKFDLFGSRIWITPHGQETPRSTRKPLLEPASPDDSYSDSEDGLSPEKSYRSVVQPKATKPSDRPKPRDTRQLIPRIKQPVYDRLSKSQFEPGSIIDPPLVDDTWLMQKHRDIIRDYSDVHPDEKEFISEWDAFVNRECITSEPHLQDAYLKFTENKASWLAVSQSRVTEWAKHLNYLKARDCLTDSTIQKALDIMRHARSQTIVEIVEPAKPPSPKSEYRKSESGCAICRQPVRSPSTLICSNLDCPKALFHINCARENATIPVESRHWRCNKCATK